MAILRTKSRLTIPAPPPSPIPTGSGSRSAANETFKQFLEKSIQLPQLSLPESRLLSGANPRPEVIDYRSLKPPRDGESIARMLRSVKEFGAFRLVSHGISSEEILSLMNEAKCISKHSSEKDKEIIHTQNGNREIIVQIRYQNGNKTSATPPVQAEVYENISQKMENIAIKLEAIAEELSAIIAESIEDHQFAQNVKKEERESIFTIYRYNHHDLFNGNLPPIKDENSRETDENLMMSLHIPGEHCQFCVNPEEGDRICFDAGADTIVATIGKQLQGESKNATSEMKFGPDLYGNQAHFAIELNISGPYSLQKAHSKVISIADQILIALLIASFYLFYIYISSIFKGK